MPQKSSAKEAYWRKILDQQQECGQSIHEFCRQRDLSEASFYFWRKEIRKRPATQASRKSGSRSAGGQRKGNGSAFIPLRLTGASVGALELVHPRGHVLRIPAGFDRESLQQVLELLDSAREA
jgi:hypothetical protein